MVANSVDNILKNKNLNVTEIRRHIISLLQKPGTALTQKELEEGLEKSLKTVDRVTLYRTIKTLSEKNIIHPITIDANTVKYKLIGEFKKGDHPHFLCCKCNKIVCMPQLEINKGMLPSGFSISSSQVVIEGTCPKCNQDSRPTDHQK